MSVSVVPAISSFTTLEEGQLLLVKFDTNEWYLAQPRENLGHGRYEVQYANGKIGTLNPGLDEFYPVHSKNVGRRFTDLEAKALRKAKAPLRVAPETPEDDTGFWQGLPERLVRAYSPAWGATDALRLSAYCEMIWRWFNQHKFNGRLVEPNFGFVTRRNTRVRGRWWPEERRIEFSPRVFNSPIENFLRVFLHEMCHQAVTEVDQVKDYNEGGHGANWMAWMRKVGLKPNRYDLAEKDIYLSDDEREKKRVLEERREEVWKKTKQEVHLKRFASGLAAKYINPNTGEAVNGLLIEATDQRQKSWAVLDEHNRVLRVPAVLLYETTWRPSKALIDKIERLRVIVERKKALRRALR